MRRLLAVGLVALAALAGPARAEPVLWRLRDADSTVTLLPAVHALPPGVTWRGPKIDAALANAEVIVFEFTQDPSPGERATIQQSLERLGRARSRRPLSARLPSTARVRLRTWAPRLGLDVRRLDRLRPWYAALLIEQAAERRAGARPGLGVEGSIMALAAGRRTEALESSDAIVSTLAGFPDNEALARLTRLLGDLSRTEDAPPDFALERAWAQGRIGPIMALVEAQREGSPGIHARLVSDRNRRWAPRIEQLLAGKDDVLVVVGAAHLVGTDGLPALLRARGYVVEGPR